MTVFTGMACGASAAAGDPFEQPARMARDDSARGSKARLNVDPLATARVEGPKGTRVHIFAGISFIEEPIGTL